jgi:hypothetical protein
MMNKSLTESEIKTRRRILFGKFGPYAFAMTNDEVQMVYDKLSSKSNQSLSPIALEKPSLDNASKNSNA